MSRSVRWAVLLTAFCVAAAVPLSAAELVPSALVPSDTSFYLEANLSRVRGEAPNAPALGEWLGRAVAAREAWRLMRQNPHDLGGTWREAAKSVDALAPILASAGPRVGLAMWIPAAGSHQRNEWLLVAGVRDEAAFDRACLRARGIYADKVTDRPTGDLPGAALSLMYGSDCAIARGNGWAAFGTPAKVTEAARRAAGKVGDSLQSQEAYQRALRGIPSDAAVTQYVSGALLKRAMEPLVALRPGTSVSSPADGIAWAIDLRVESRDGRQMVIADWIMDLSNSIYLLDAPAAAWGLPAAVEAKNDAIAENACRNHMTVLAQAMLQYTKDHEGRFPRADRWVEELSKYLSDPQVLKCPNDLSAARCSYGMNFALSGKPLPEGADPARVVVFYETSAPGSNPTGYQADEVQQSSLRHSNGTLRVLADGSVEQGWFEREWLGPGEKGK